MIMDHLARHHVWVIAVSAIVVCIGYALIAIFAPQTATALGVLYIAFLMTATVLLRKNRT